MATIRRARITLALACLFVDPVQELLDPRVDPRHVVPGAPFAPAHHADHEGPRLAPSQPLPQRAATVAGASVFAAITRMTLFVYLRLVQCVRILHGWTEI